MHYELPVLTDQAYEYGYECFKNIVKILRRRLPIRVIKRYNLVVFVNPYFPCEQLYS